MSYPDSFYRGIDNKQAFDNEGRPLAGLYNFKNTGRGDSFEEASITWKDEEESLDIILKQTTEKNNETVIQFKEGVAEIDRLQLDVLIKKPACKGFLKYERAADEYNKYHGNLLMLSGLSKQQRSVVYAALSFSFLKKIPNDFSID